MNTSSPTAFQITSRVLASLVGGWGFVWGFSALGIALLVSGGMAYDEAFMLAMLVAFLLFLALFCWAFAASSLARVWTVLAGGGAAMTLAAWLLVGQLQATA